MRAFSHVLYLLPALVGILLYITMRNGCQAQPDTRKVCDSSRCTLPNCLCAGKDIPGGLGREQVPQMVLFTFDDAISEQVYEPLLRLFGPGNDRKNPNGCPIGMTLFVPHISTNYCKVAEFWEQGHEVASHSINHHHRPIEYWSSASYSDYDIEIDGQSNMLALLSGIDRKTIRGYRSPFLQPGGDTQFQVLQARKYLYDSSLLVASPQNEDAFWPYTLNFSNQVPCEISPCPQGTYPDIWELPLQPIPDQSGAFCTFLDSCTEVMTESEIYNYLRDSFDRLYTTNRAPFIIKIHSYWLDTNKTAADGLERFINDIVAMDDVWLITCTQLVEWLRTPTAISELGNFTEWQCSETPSVSTGCTREVLKPGSNRSRKKGFEPYQSRLQTGLYQRDRPADGGMSWLLTAVAVFTIAFIYLQVQQG